MFLPAGVAEAEVEDGDVEVDESVSTSTFTSLHVVLVKNLFTANVSERCAKSVHQNTRRSNVFSF